LDVTGVLEEGDRITRTDNILYDGYTFEGRAGQRVSIVMESLEFNPYLILGDPLGKKIAENDDHQTSRNAVLVITLTQNGTYVIVASASDAWSRGRYRLTVISTTPNQQEPILSSTAVEQIRAGQLNQQGLRFSNVSRFQEALSLFQQAQTIYRRIGDRGGEGTTLNNIGFVYSSLGQYPKALEYYQQALAIRQDDRRGEGTTLNNIGLVYDKLGQPNQALEYYQQALVISREVGNRAGEGGTLDNIGGIYNNLGQYRQALEYHQQALAIRREVRDRNGEGYTLNNIGAVYDNLGQYRQALEYYQQALTIRQEVRDRYGEGNTLDNIGVVYGNLGQFTQALQYFQQALAISREVRDRPGEANTLSNLGAISDDLRQHNQALQYLQQALVIFREVRDRRGEGRTLYNLGAVYDSLKQPTQALTYNQQALTIFREVGDRNREGRALNNIGVIYNNLGQYDQALEYYEQALAIHREVNNSIGVGIAIANIGRTLVLQDKPELAIAFYKQSINQLEAIRGDLRTLTREQQQSFTDTIEKHYRRLADLLLQQNRVIEAQRVLDLLKVQELDDYLRGVQRNAQTASGIPLRPEEQEALQLFDANQSQLIALGQELAQLQKIPSAQRTSAQRDRIIQLAALQRIARQRIETFFELPEIKAIVERLQRTTGAASLPVGQLNQLQDNLQRLQQNAVILYPLILEDRLELVLVSANSPPIRRTAQVRREDLNRAIAEFRSALQSPSRDARTPAQQLYQWLIRPIENDLKQANATTIIYAPDLQLRYIPLAALHDGTQWLAQRFAINNITAASLSDLNAVPNREDLSILAGAFTQGSHNVRIGDRTVPFAGLEFAGREVTNLANLMPQTVKRLDQAFNLSLVDEMNEYRIVHLATHASFNPGPPENSFILESVCKGKLSFF
jgi:CHAT domain-containing protein/tetratricopeptide (TPR) repeat protein